MLGKISIILSCKIKALYSSVITIIGKMTGQAQLVALRRVVAIWPHV